MSISPMLAHSSQRPTLLLVNGLILGAVALLQFVLDFVAYWFALGPTAPALHGNLDTIGYAEAHGLALGLAALLILRRRDGWAGWHLVAGLAHGLLGICNLIFWPLFATWNLEPMGVAATAMHAIFVGFELNAYFGWHRGRLLSRA